MYSGRAVIVHHSINFDSWRVTYRTQWLVGWVMNLESTRTVHSQPMNEID